MLLNSRVKAICWSESWSWWSVFTKCYVNIFSWTFYKTQISGFNITCFVADFVRLCVVAYPFNTAGKADIHSNNSSFISVLWRSKSFMLRSIIEVWSFILSRQSTVISKLSRRILIWLTEICAYKNKNYFKMYGFNNTNVKSFLRLK